MRRGIFSLQQRLRRVSLENFMNLMTPLNNHGFDGVDDTFIHQISPEAIKRKWTVCVHLMTEDLSVQHMSIVIHRNPLDVFSQVKNESISSEKADSDCTFNTATMEFHFS